MRSPTTSRLRSGNIPGYSTRDFALLDLTADILGNGKNSRLYKRLVYTDQIATSVSAGMGPFEIGSQFQLVATVTPGGDVAAVEKALDEEVRGFLDKGPTAQELQRLKTADYAALVRAAERIDGSGGKASILGESQLYGGSPEFYKTSLNWLHDATVADVHRAARDWLCSGACRGRASGIRGSPSGSCWRSVSRSLG